MKMSVILPTHNPSRKRLELVLKALADQTLSMDNWELVVVDNASDSPVDVKWLQAFFNHNGVRVMLEPTPGLTRARLCGVRESAGAVLVFVDDDNVLESDYLEEVARLGREWPMLGVWGGSRRAIWEGEPCGETARYWGMLSVGEVERVSFSNFSHDPGKLPTGAGLCVRRSVMEEYARQVAASPARGALDRTGGSLSSCGDFDIGFTAYDLGLGAGLFPELRLDHLLDARRSTLPYLLKLRKAVSYSMALLEWHRYRIFPSEGAGWSGRLRAFNYQRTADFQERQMHRAHLEGLDDARAEISQWQKP